MAESKSGGGSSATQDKPSPATQAKQSRTDESLKSERKAGDERFGGDEPLPYPEHEPLDTVTYKDPRPHDWPVKADRSVFIGPVRQVNFDPESDDEPKGDYVYRNQITDDPNDEGEIELSGAKVEDAQVIAGGGRLTLVINGDAHDLTGLGQAIQGDLAEALQLNANS